MTGSALAHGRGNSARGQEMCAGSACAAYILLAHSPPPEDTGNERLPPCARAERVVGESKVAVMGDRLSRRMYATAYIRVLGTQDSHCSHSLGLVDVAPPSRGSVIYYIYPAAVYKSRSGLLVKRSRNVALSDQVFVYKCH